MLESTWSWQNSSRVVWKKIQWKFIMKRWVGWVLRPSCEQCQDSPKENLCQSNIGCWTADNHFSWDWGTPNSRPLTCLSADPGDYSVITPAQILIGRNHQASPAKDTHVTEHTSRTITKSSVSTKTCQLTLEALACWVPEFFDTPQKMVYGWSRDT